MKLFQLIYGSRPFGFDSSILSGILLESRENNKRDGVTGALICRGDLYLQLLEGTEAAIKNTYERILKDDRHLEIKKLVWRRVPVRLFPEWAMRDDPAKSWLWSKSQIENGALENASEEELVSVFFKLASGLKRNDQTKIN
tara:strand:- start:432 stop:854 length:423 start_codon:yes stop_codon:yes gene_type:complete